MKFPPTPKPRIQNVFLMSRGMSQCVGWFWKKWILWFILQSLTQSKTFRRRRATWARTSPSRSSSSPTQPPPRSSGSLSSQPNQVQLSSTKRDSFSCPMPSSLMNERCYNGFHFEPLVCLILKSKPTFNWPTGPTDKSLAESDSDSYSHNTWLQQSQCETLLPVNYNGLNYNWKYLN